MTLRSIRPADEAAYLDILERTSDDDRYFRFFRAVDHFEHRDVVRFVEPRPDTIGLIAEEDGVGLGTAHAFLEGGVAEFSIVVASNARNRGVAHALLERLVAMLQARAIPTLVAYSLTENYGFARLAKSIGMKASHAVGDGSVVTWSLSIKNDGGEPGRSTVSPDASLYRRSRR